MQTTAIVIARAEGVKCERCWRYVKNVSSDPEWAGLCERCQGALAEDIRARESTGEREVAGSGESPRADE